MTTTEERIINTLVRNSKAEILFDYDAYYVDDENNEAGLFARKYKKVHPQWIENGISKALTTESKTIHIINASGNAMQAKALQAILQEIHDEKQNESKEKQDEKLAVILADENLLIPVLNSIPNTFSGFKVSMGYPITKTPVNQLVKECFTLYRHKRISRKINDNGTERVAEGWYIWPVLHLMDLEIIKIVFSRNELEAFSHWKQTAVKNGKFIFEDSDLESFQQMPNIQAFLKVILNKKDESSPAIILEDLNQVLVFISHLLQLKPEQERNQFLLNQVSEIGKIISRLQKVIGQNAQYVKDAHSLESLYRVLSSAASLKLNSSETDGLQIMGLLETRNLDFERLHLLSVNEGILPPDKSRGSFIPQFIRHACGLPDYADSQAVVAYNFYRLLQNGKDIYLYYNNLGDTSGGEASGFILQIKHELAKNPNIKIYRPLARIVRKCTAFSPKERFADVSQVKKALLHANPKSQALRMAAIAVCAVLAVVLLTFTGVKIYQAVTYTPFTDDAIPAYLPDEQRIAEAVTYMKDKYGIKSGPLADRLPDVTLAAKNLATEMTNLNVERNDLYGEAPITAEHVDNNTSVRKMLGERGILPEELPPAEDTKKIERRIKNDEKKLTK